MAIRTPQPQGLQAFLARPPRDEPSQGERLQQQAMSLLMRFGPGLLNQGGDDEELMQDPDPILDAMNRNFFQGAPSSLSRFFG